MKAATWWLVKKTVPKHKWSFEASRCHSKVRYWNKWLRRMVHNAAARYEPMARYFSGVVSRLCICSLHAVVTVLFHARLNIHICTILFLYIRVTDRVGLCECLLFIPTNRILIRPDGPGINSRQIKINNEGNRFSDKINTFH